MDRLYLLTEEQFQQINRCLPPEDQGRGRPPKISNRDALEGVLHILRTGTPWRDLSAAYGHWHTIYMRWWRWIERGIWPTLLKMLKRLKGLSLRIVFADSTLVRAHHHAAGALRRYGNQSLGRSRGGLTTKIHVLCTSESDALEVRLTPGQAGDAPTGEVLIDTMDCRDGIAQAVMDKAYDSNTIRAQLNSKGIEPVIPPKANRVDFITYDHQSYQQRKQVERLINKLKQFRRVATRYEKLSSTFLAFVTLGFIVIMLR